MKTLRFLVLTLLAVGAAATGLARSEKSNVGSKLPSLASLDYLDAKPETAGKPVLLEFWATWCPPCRASIPHLNEIHAKFKDRGLVIIGASSEGKDAVRKFRETTPMNYTVALDKGGRIGKGLGVGGIPHAVVADKSGKIVWEGHPMGLDEKVLEDVLK